MFKFKRMWVLFMARNREFTRDRAGFGWNILFPFLLVAGFGLMFGQDGKKEFKMGIFPVAGPLPAIESLHIPERLKESGFMQLVYFDTRETAMDRLRHHKVDILVENRPNEKLRYWISDSSPKGVLMEKVVQASLIPDRVLSDRLEKQAVSGREIRYIDWLFPGILGMSIMFSALFGVGWVIVRYRRNGVLKRLKATPVTAFEYLSAQLLSRLLVIMCSSTIVWAGCDLLFSFNVRGRILDVAVVFLAGTACMACFGLALACRGTNEELVNGAINFICWPMMFLSEVWFSIEGAAPWLKQVAAFLPLSHFLSAARKVINDGAGLAQVSHELAVMGLMGFFFLAVGARLFSWTK